MLYELTTADAVLHQPATKGMYCPLSSIPLCLIVPFWVKTARSEGRSHGHPLTRFEE